MKTQSSTFLRFTKLIILICLTILGSVLALALLKGSKAKGEVAMLMFVLTMPLSLAVGAFLNAISFSPPSLNNNLHLFFVWLPFFIGGLVQALVIFFVAKLLATNRPYISADLFRRPMT